ncbi:MAG: tRNA (guanosine(37)-N1)-methyltransferase TrmD [Acidobacteria bacterium]|nr:tRNA (guanosine(37)-N1)-methyltransferase TrmD [Acidobacteriota bacterium]
MRFDIITIFPEFFDGPLDYGIVRRARETGLLEVEVHDLREFTRDRHRTVDDRPFGGGEGMVLKPEPLFEAVEALLAESQGPAPGTATPPSTAVVLLSASGKLFRQETARRYAGLERVILLCGRYEGVDERVAEHLATEEVAVGDFVLSGGELPAAMIVDAVTRLLPGALGNEASAVHESFSMENSSPLSVVSRQEAEPVAGAKTRPFTSHESQVTSHGILDCPHYTRPAEFRGWGVPEVLTGGNHEQIRRWRRRMALAKTLRNRPELLDTAALSAEDRRLLEELRREGQP